MIVPGLLRAKLLLTEYGQFVVLGLVVVGVIAFASVGALYFDPPSETVVEQRHVQTIETEPHTSAVVTANSSIWKRGAVIEDSPIYPLELAPEMTLRIRTLVPSGRSVDVAQNLTLVYRATASGTVLWQSSRRLSKRVATVNDGDAVMETTIDMRKVRSRKGLLSRELHGIGDVEVFLQLNVSYETDRYDGRLSASAPIEVTTDSYRLRGSLATDRTHSTRVTRQVTKSPDHDLAATLAGLGILAFASAGGLEFVSRRDWFDPVRLRNRLDAARYDTWISKGHLPAVESPVLRLEIGEEHIRMDSLQDLVDVAIDSNKRVIHDHDHDVYAVLHDQVIYYFNPNADPDGFQFDWHSVESDREVTAHEISTVSEPDERQSLPTDNRERQIDRASASNGERPPTESANEPPIESESDQSDVDPGDWAEETDSEWTDEDMDIET